MMYYLWNVLCLEVRAELLNSEDYVTAISI